ncbi:conserved hypothetical protein [Desulforapulum autotrophicum HRM2]|uniref:Uncharacterized protein n=1 Tax=Desulforapulum autotrophicum (strain ATCC 43914 / DSM 3382 / VKM B-1955 / HRM2) TaxID=177437 RepID=C0QII7_DESAH|nr:conserved hypothetical protein [Desulforapulum autotrophicum HRM2]
MKKASSLSPQIHRLFFDTPPKGIRKILLGGFILKVGTYYKNGQPTLAETGYHDYVIVENRCWAEGLEFAIYK